MLICSFFYWLYEIKRDKKKNNKISQENQNVQSSRINSVLIFHDIYYYGNKKISDFFTYITILLFVLVEHIDRIVHRFFSYGDYWMFELLIMAYLHNKLFNLKIFKHQKLSIYSVSLPVLLKTVTIIFFFLDKNNHLKNNEINYRYNDKTTLFKILYVAHAWLFPIAMILYIIVMFANSYLIINIKKIIDLKFFSISKLLLFYGLFGTIYSSLIALIATFISCGKLNDKIYDINDYICFVVDKDNNRYVDSYIIYFTGTIWKDILYTLNGAVAYNIYTLFVFQIVKHLNPIYKSFFIPVTYFIQKLILMYQINSNEPRKYLNVSFFIDFSSDITAIIGFLIYLEIIELNFCKLNKDLRKNIIMRGEIDQIDYEKDKGTTVLDNESNNYIEIGKLNIIESE